VFVLRHAGHCQLGELAVLFDIANGQLIATAPAMREFSPDGSRLLATGTGNLVLSVLDAATGAELCSAPTVRVHLGRALVAGWDARAAHASAPAAARPRCTC